MNNKLITLIILSLLCSCISKSPFVNTGKAKEHDEQIYEYLQKADHLTDEQKAAMKNYEPFIEMSIDEARIAMEQIGEPDITFNSKAFQAVFIGQYKTKYVLIFNLGAPNRVVEWTVFSGEDVREISQPRDHRPKPTIPIVFIYFAPI